MPELEVGTSSSPTDQPYLIRYTGEQFPLVLSVVDRNKDTALDISNAELTLDLGAVVKDNVDFVCPYENENNKAKTTIEEEDTSDPVDLEGQLKMEFIEDEEVRKTHPITILIISGECVLTVEDMRMDLYDVAAENDLWESVEFSTPLLIRARRRAIEEWNAQPGRHVSLDENSVPEDWAQKWSEGAVGHALRMKARQLAGSDLSGSIGDVQVEDKKPRIQLYNKLAQPRLAAWRRFIKGQQYLNTIRRSYRKIG